MSQITGRCLTLVLLACGCCSGQDQSSAKNSSVTESSIVIDLTESLKRQAAAIKTFSVTIKTRRFDNLAAAFGGGGHSRSTSSEKWQVEPSGRGWSEGTRKQLNVDQKGKRNEIDVNQRAFFDGENGIRLTTTFNPAYGRNKLSAQETASVHGLTLSPLNITVAHQERPILNTLAKRKVTVVGTEAWQGRELTILESEPVQNSSFYKSQYWIDAQRGHAIVRRINMTAEAAGGPWAPSYAVNSLDHQQVAPGIWLPSRFQVRSYVGKSKDGESEPPVAMRVDGTCSDWTIDQPLETDQLSIEVPRSARLRKLTGEPEKKEAKRLQSFFFCTITTSLQRNLVGKNVDAYGAIDVASVNCAILDSATSNFR